MVHRRRHPQEVPNYPQYEWAFDEAGEPVPIALAMRSKPYFCPLCGGRMIARLGDLKRHHFAHEELRDCPPDEVARAAAGRWLARHIQSCLDARRELDITWPCPYCQQTHTTNLLAGVTQVRQDHVENGLRADVALLTAAGKLRAVIAVNMPSPDALTYFAHEGVAVIVVSLKNIRTKMLNLPALLSGSTIHGGVCTVQQKAAEKGIVADIPTLREYLTDAANLPPYRFYGSLETLDGMSHIFRLGKEKLWLPPILWQRAIGGLLHSISPALQIVSQEWPQPDGGVIALYYVTVKDTHAIAVRRFAVDQPVYARLGNSAFRTTRVTALDIAKSLAEG